MLNIENCHKKVLGIDLVDLVSKVKSLGTFLENCMEDGGVEVKPLYILSRVASIVVHHDEGIYK